MLEGRKERNVMPGLSGCSLLPGLGSLAHTQPVCAGLGLGHRAFEPREPNRDSSNPEPREQTRDPGSLLCHPFPGRFGCYLICLHRPPGRLSFPQNTQTRRASAVRVFYFVQSPRSQPRARWLPVTRASPPAHQDS